MFRHLIRSDAVEIAAPVEQVWEVLADFGRYGEWNPFTTRVDTNFEVGSPVDLHVTLGPLKREQRLEPLGATRCRYLTADAFTGLLTPLVVLLFGGLVRGGFNAMAVALKERAEASHR